MQGTEPLASLWHQTVRAADAAPKAVSFARCQDASLDAIVVGAGVTGLSTALHLAESGARVAVLDRDAPGRGTTGSSNGQIIAGLHEPPEAILAAYGEDVGERLVEFSGTAPDRLFDLVKRHGIDCDAERFGYIQAARSRHGVRMLEEVAESWAKRGAPVQVLGAEETARQLGTSAYAGSWQDLRGGVIQPYAYALGLARAASSAGAMLCHPVTVRDIDRCQRRWQVETDKGTLSAPTVIVATNTGTHGLDGVVKTFLGRSYVAGYSVQLASEPLDAAQLETLLPERSACADTSHVRLRYFRLDRDNRFIIGGPGGLWAPHSGSSLAFDLLETSTRRMFPQLARTAFPHRWAARDTVTLDLMPHLYEPEPGLFSALGFNGRGLAIGTSLGIVLANRAGGQSAAEQPFPTTQASPLPLDPLTTVGFHLKVLCSRLFARSR